MSNVYNRPKVIWTLDSEVSRNLNRNTQNDDKVAVERTSALVGGSSFCPSVTDLYPEEVRDDVWCTGSRLALLWDSQRAGLYLSLWKQTHLQLYCHLPSSCHLTHELGREKREDKNRTEFDLCIMQFIGFYEKWYILALPPRCVQPEATPSRR